MKRSSKILGILIAIAMIFSVIPMGSIAYAAEGDVEINAVNFPDDTFRSYVKSFDENNDDVLSSEEIAAVTEIDVSDATSLKGVEYFTEIESLAITDSTFKTVDISKNTKMT